MVKIRDNATKIDAILTTYDMLKAKGVAQFFTRKPFRYVVLDEGHIIKNEETGIAQACRALKSYSKVILTGTPLQNNLHELWALLNYLYPEYFEESDLFDSGFNIGANSVVDKSILLKCNVLLQKFMLRRLKAEVEKLMPKKVETQVQCPLSTMQVHWYKSLLMKDMSLLAKLQAQVNGDKDDGQSTGNNYKRLSNLIMQLRKVLNHPYQFDGAEVDPSTTTLADLVGHSGKLAMLDKLLVELYKNGHRVCIFSQFTRVLDIINDYCDMRGWKYSRLDGSTGRSKRSYIVDRFNTPQSEEFLFLMSTRAGGMGLNLQSADTVVLFDSDWNPQPDIQAMARVHRIGQKKTVHVYRLVCSGTVEERIVQRAQKKLYMDRMVNSTEVSRMTQSVKEEATEEEQENGGLGMAELLDSLTFGSDAVFGSGKVSWLPA
jgi:SWI/SNF-related matrix-associated actin-dependent regulator of chromatin subfamily A member 5